VWEWAGSAAATFPNGDTSVDISAQCTAGVGIAFFAVSQPSNTSRFANVVQDVAAPDRPLTYHFAPPLTDGGFITAAVFDQDPGPGPGPYFPPACYPSGPPIFQNPPGWLDLARIIAKVYANDGTAKNDLGAFLAPGAGLFQWVNDSSLLPGMALAYDGQQCFVAMAGTTNFQQLATQIAYGATGPTNVGAFSTNLQWYISAIAIGSRISSQGVSATLPITICGHSYGGALAVVLAAVFKLAQPERHVNVITYGMPRPGDRRLAAKVAGIRQFHLSNVADPVTALPPIGLELLPFGLLVPGPLYEQWSTMDKPHGQILINRDGGLFDTEAPALLYSALLDAINVIVVNGTLPAFTNHTIAEYVRRLELAT